MSVLPLTFVICSLTLAEVGHTFFFIWNNVYLLIFFKFLYCVDNCNADAHADFLVVFHFYNELRHTHKQEMELKTCVCTSSYFCHFFTNSCWGRTYFFLSEIMFIYSFFYYIISYYFTYISFFYIYFYYFLILYCFILFCFIILTQMSIYLLYS